MMKAHMLYGQDDIKNHPLKFEDTNVPVPTAGQVLIKVKACGICRTDLHVIEGDLPLKMTPTIPGHQVVGEVVQCGKDVQGFNKGERLGVAWLEATCGICKFCTSGRENLCDKAVFSGWTAQGGYAEYMTAASQFLYKLPDGFSDIQAAPLLCGGIIGYRSLRMMNIPDWSGRRIGIYGFGAAGHIAIQLLRAWGADVYVCTREKEHRTLAENLGATWVGGIVEQPPTLLDASVVFAPAGDIIPPALEALDKDGRLILAGIHMSPVPSFSYDILYGERLIKSVTNNTRQDGIRFLEHAAKIGIKAHVTTFPLSEANEALCALKYDYFKGAGVLVM